MSVAERIMEAQIDVLSAESEFDAALLELEIDYEDWSVDYYDNSIEIRVAKWLAPTKVKAVLALGFSRMWEHVGAQERYSYRYEDEIRICDIKASSSPRV